MMDIGLCSPEPTESKLDIYLKEVPKETALQLVQKYHYSNKLPHLNKYYLGIYINNELNGVITLGYGTKPKHTIQKMFPSLNTKDYLEIGRMCIDDKYGKNTESQMLSKLIKWIKNNLNIKLLFTWSDGIWGKAGFVYQASNFLYGGYIETEIYVYNNVRIHPFEVQKLMGIYNYKTKVRPTANQKKEFGIEHYKGRMFRYVYFVCGFSEKKRLLNESPITWSRKYPKAEDCVFKKWVAPYKFVKCKRPPICSDSFEDILSKKSFIQTTLDGML